MKALVFALAVCLPLSLCAQEPNPTQSVSQQPPSSANPNPVFRVEVVSRSIAAISYRNRSGWTKVDFQGTSLAPQAKGQARVNSRLGNMEIQFEVKNLPAPKNFGPLFLTYVLWAVTPEGRAANLGEVVVDSDGNYKGTVTTNLQSFGLIITAEPYFAVRQPSDVVVMENIVRSDTLGKFETVEAKYELLPRGQYTYHVPEAQLHPIDYTDKKNPLQLYEAQNAIDIAQYAKADQYASDVFQNAQALLSQAEDYQARKQWKPAIMTAKEAVQKAEDARIVSLRRQQQEALDKERQDAAARQAAAQQQAEEERQRAEQARLQAEADARARDQAQQQAEAEARARADADAARAQAAAEAQKAQQAAAEADRLRQQAEQDRNALRERLLQQFNAVLPTRETPRGLVVNMSDVLFDFGKYTLKDNAKLALARISGIIISHPGLNLVVEGYTDSIGSDEYNQKLSEQRADTVRDFLVSQGLNMQMMSAVGYGKAYPVAPNDTAANRALNRRVELVVSGEVIGVKIGVAPGQSSGVQTPGAAPGPGMSQQPVQPGPPPQSPPQR